MILQDFDHRGRRWTALLHPSSASDDSDCGMELIFVSRAGPETKLVLPVDQETLEGLRRTGGLSDADLRALLDRAEEWARRRASAEDSAEPTRVRIPDTPTKTRD